MPTEILTRAVTVHPDSGTQLFRLGDQLLARHRFEIFVHCASEKDGIPLRLVPKLYARITRHEDVSQSGAATIGRDQQANPRSQQKAAVDGPRVQRSQ